MPSWLTAAVVGGVRIAATYVPNGGKDYDAKIRFLTDMAAWVDERRAAGEPLAICGDLNVALEDRDIHNRERKPNQIGARPEERALIRRLIDAGLVDKSELRIRPTESHLGTLDATDEIFEIIDANWPQAAETS